MPRTASSVASGTIAATALTMVGAVDQSWS